MGYSDWAFSTIPYAIDQMGYRISRKGSDFLVEYSYDNIIFHSIRIFHLHGIENKNIYIGLYGCSPDNSSFQCEFCNVWMKDSQWLT
ncbi:DUF1349 domain-containing protein [Spirochaetales bacterium BR193]|uniref:DUF1349 domain-containing protein n=1 Tax=Entomospira entomophila TaxID=2719988 RepID=A0A968GEK3_9SPIO|nr:DUF1349 domain-containing protein [Entomospira entomophilus]